MVKKILTVSELADHLSVHRITIYRLLKSGSIPGFKIGRVWRFEFDQISTWMTTGILPLEAISGGAGAQSNGGRESDQHPGNGPAQKRKKSPPGN